MFKRVIPAALAALTIVGLAGCGGGAMTIEKAAKACDSALVVDDDGRSITFDTKGEEDYGDDDSTPLGSVDCMFTNLKVPDAIVERIEHTRALDGVQSADWDKYHASWSYHPDSGMFLVVETKK